MNVNRFNRVLPPVLLPLLLLGTQQTHEIRDEAVPLNPAYRRAQSI